MIKQLILDMGWDFSLIIFSFVGGVLSVKNDGSSPVKKFIQVLKGVVTSLILVPFAAHAFNLTSNRLLSPLGAIIAYSGDSVLNKLKSTLLTKIETNGK